MNDVVSLRLIKSVRGTLMLCLTLATPVLAHAQSMPLPHVSPHPAQTVPMSASLVPAAIAHSPLSFEANMGQTDKNVRFMARGTGYSLFLTPTNAVFDFQEPTVRTGGASKVLRTRPSVSHQIFAMQLVGTAAHPEITGVDRLPGKINYFHGSDAAKWHTNVATFDKVRYRSIYPGIDLLYYGNQQRLEYDFIVAPHRNPSQIAFKMQGSESLKIDKNGDLIVGFHKGEIRWHKPVVYQEVKGHRKGVDGRYRLNGNRIAFSVSHYDAARPLVIDPQLLYSTYLGGTNASGNVGNGIAVHTDSGTGKTYVYITGTGNSTDYPIFPAPSTTPGVYPKVSQGGEEAFITKMDLTQSGAASLVYSTYLGSKSDDEGNAIAVDSSGNAYIAGTTHASVNDFPVTPGAFFTLADNPTNDQRGFMAKLSNDGTSLLYCTYLSVGTRQTALGIALGKQVIGAGATDEVYITGGATAQPHLTNGHYDYPLKNAFSGPHGTGTTYDAYVIELDISQPASSALLYGTFLGGDADDVGRGIAADKNGRAYITGSTQSSVFPAVNAFQTTFGSGAGTSGINAFVAAFNTKATTSAGTLTYCSYFGDITEEGYGIAVDGSGYVYIAGYSSTATPSAVTSAPGFPTTANAFQRILANGTAAFLAKFDVTQSGTSSLLYSTLYGQPGSADYAYGIAVGAAGNAYLTGFAEGNLPATLNAFQLLDAYSTGSDAFIAQIDTTQSGAAGLIYATYLGGGYNDIGSGVAVDGTGLVYITGNTASYYDTGTSIKIPFPTTSTAYQPNYRLSNAGGNFFPNVFVAQLSTTPNSFNHSFDFNGDGWNDLVFQNANPGPDLGKVVLWFMHANQFLGGGPTSVTPAAGYQVMAARDFNGDGLADLVFQNTSTGNVVIWYMNGTTVSGGATVGIPVSGYTVAGVGYFNADTYPDLLFQNTATGSVAVWYMNGATVVSGAVLSAALPAGYKIAGVGDFGGPSHSDIVLQNASTGGVLFWIMNGSVVVNTVTLTGPTTLTGTPPNFTLPSGYQIAAIADYNGDGYTDMVLQNPSSGALLYLFMNKASVYNTFITGLGTTASTPYSGYILSGPH